MVDLTPGPAEMAETPDDCDGWSNASAPVIREFQNYVRSTYLSYGWDPKTHWVFRAYPDMSDE